VRSSFSDSVTLNVINNSGLGIDGYRYKRYLNSSGKGNQPLKNPVVERQRTLKTEVMGFRAGKLVRVKTSSNKYQKNHVFRF
jgi:hypothetical protein